MRLMDSNVVSVVGGDAVAPCFAAGSGGGGGGGGICEAGFLV